MELARPLTDADSVVRPVWLDTVVVKLVDVETMTLYVAAFVAVPQLKVSEVGWFVAPFDGDESAGPAYGMAPTLIAPVIRNAAAKEAIFNQERDITHPFL